MNATADLPQEVVPIVEDEPEQTRRLQALLEAHRLGIVFFGGSAVVNDEGARIYAVIYRDQGYALRAAEVLPAVYFMAASFGTELADRLKYRAGLHVRRPALPPA